MKKVIAVVVLTVTTVACAGRVAQVYVEADSAAVASLSKFKADKDARCDAGQIPASACQAVAQAFVPVWDAYLAVNSLITAEAPIKEVDAAVVKFRQAAADLRDAVNKIEGNARQILLDFIEQALRRFDR